MLYKQRQSRFWWVKFTAAGVVIRKSTGTADRREAEKIARAIRVNYDKARPAVRHGVTLGEVAAAEIERAAMAASDPDVARSYSESYWRNILRALGPDTPVMTLGNHSPQDVVEYMRERGLSGQTTRKALHCLRRGVQIALSRRWIAIAPIDDWPKVASSPKRAAQAGKLHPPEIIRAWVLALSPAAADFVTWILLTGMRSAEVARCRFDWVEGDVLRLRPEGTKTKRERSVPLSPRAMDIIKRQLARRGDHPTIFGEYDHRPERERVLAELGYTKIITLRDLRHIAATLADRAGDRKAVSDLLGHSTTQMTETYLHSDAERLRLVGDTLADRVVAIIGKK